MRKVFFLLILSMLIAACAERDDDSNDVCTASCTRIQGRVFTKENAPVKNAQMVFQFRKSTGTFSDYTRVIAKARTDSNGNYAMDFYLKDEELGEAVGAFELYMTRASVPGNVFYHEDFSLWDNSIQNLQSRDTTMVKNLYLPKKKTIKVRLANFAPVIAGDMFQVQFYYPVGYENSLPNTFGNTHYYQLSGINQYMANSPLNSFDITLADGEYNILQITKIKNGVYSQDQYPILLNDASPTEFIYDY